MASFNWLDWMLVAIVMVSIVAAMFKGFVTEIISLAAVIVGLIVAALAYQGASVWFEDLTRSHDIALGLGFLGLFLGTLVLGALVSVLARKLIKKTGLEWFDRFLGGIFGLVRGVVVNSILLMALVAFSIKTEAIQRSALAPYVVTGARGLAMVMPGDLKAQFRTGFEKFRQALIQNDKKALKD